MEPFSVTCYPIPGKWKASLLCEAFASGVRAAGGTAEICTSPPRELKPGAAVFYGVRPAVKHLWDQARGEGRDWYYIDNSYFDCVRERYFRVTKNRVQLDPGGNGLISDGRRFEALGIPIRPWREASPPARGGVAAGAAGVVGDERHIVLCPQTDEYMKVVCGWEYGDWTQWASAMLKRWTQRPLRIRKKGEAKPLAEDLKNAWALVTHCSAAAVEAVREGVPALTTGESAARLVTMGSASLIERPMRPHEAIRRKVLETLADYQWTLNEIAAGEAWTKWNARSRQPAAA